MLLVGVAAVAFVSASTGSYNPTPNRLPPKPPRFSWGTVPLHMHSGNGSGTCQPHPTPTQRHTTIQILAIVSSYSLPKRVPVSLAHSSISVAKLNLLILANLVLYHPCRWKWRWLGPLSNDAAKFMARFPLVTMAGFQGNHNLLPNGTVALTRRLGSASQNTQRARIAH